jgi:hypothetical protein
MTCHASSSSPAELSAARAKLAGSGGAVQPGAWGRAARAEADGRAYLESVRDNQRELAAEARVSWPLLRAGHPPVVPQCHQCHIWLASGHRERHRRHGHHYERRPLLRTVACQCYSSIAQWAVTMPSPCR